MLLAIDVGNTHTVYGVWDGRTWRATWRRSTSSAETEDELAVWLRGMFELEGLRPELTAAICGTVVPQMRQTLRYMAERRLGIPIRFLDDGAQVGLDVDYQPPTAVGADRLCNALGALAIAEPPIIVVDFGTATTFDVIDRQGRYVGGAIVTGITTSTEALVGRTAKLPMIEYRAPERAIGKSTVESLQSGIMLGYAGAIDALVARIEAELGEKATVLATGGLGDLFVGVAKRIERFEPMLTLEGLRIAHERLAPIQTSHLS